LVSGCPICPSYWNSNNGIQALWGMITGAFSGLLESFCCWLGTSSSPSHTRCFSLFYALVMRLDPVRRRPIPVCHWYPAFALGDGQKSTGQLMISTPGGWLYSIFGHDGRDQHEFGITYSAAELRRRFQRDRDPRPSCLAASADRSASRWIPYLAKPRIVEGDRAKP